MVYFFTLDFDSSDIEDPEEDSHKIRHSTPKSSIAGKTISLLPYSPSGVDILVILVFCYLLSKHTTFQNLITDVNTCINVLMCLLMKKLSDQL